MPIIEIDDDLRDTISEALDDLLDVNVFGKTCRLIYPPIMEDCSNCLGGNAWKTGGPMPFQQGVCPQCAGSGQRATINTADIIMTINFGTSHNINNKGWSGLPLPSKTVNLPEAIIQTRGFVTDLTKVRQCDTMTIIQPNHPLLNQSFKLNNEAFDYFNIVQGRYFIAYWNRIG